MKTQNSKNNKKSNSLLGLGLLTAVTASLCCITPVLALLAGTSGMASTFTWMEPFRPYLIGITVLVLAFAWVQQLKPKKDINCDCDTNKKPTFIKSNLFLGLITVFALVMLAFPYYSKAFYPINVAKVTNAKQHNIQELTLNVKGMTCESCNLHVEHEVAKLPGYMDAKADYKTGIVHVKFDNTKTSKQQVINTVNKTGYKVVGEQNNNSKKQ